jgi:hypothetical protein
VEFRLYFLAWALTIRALVVRTKSNRAEGSRANKPQSQQGNQNDGRGHTCGKGKAAMRNRIVLVILLVAIVAAGIVAWPEGVNAMLEDLYNWFRSRGLGWK